MTSIHNASIVNGEETTALTVAALEPHGVNAEVACQIFAVNETSDAIFELVKLKPKQCAVIYPTTNKIIIRNIGTGDGYVQVTAK